MPRSIEADTGALVRLCDAGKRYRWGSPWVLRDVNVAVDRGCLVEVRGANGAGKSTLLRMLAGATLPTCGRRAIASGVDVGYGPERLTPAPPFSAAAYLAHHTRLRCVAPAEGERRVAALSARLGLQTRLLAEPMGTLSKGSLQKVAVIQALLGRPALIVLDEPFAGLDLDAACALAELISETTATGSTVVFSDHRERDLRLRADRLWSLSNASVHQQRIERAARGLPRLPGLLSVTEHADGLVALVLTAQVSDQALAILIEHGWHIVAMAAGATPDCVRIEAAPASER